MMFLGSTLVVGPVVEPVKVLEEEEEEEEEEEAASSLSIWSSSAALATMMS